MDELKNYLQQNRGQLDTDTPPAGLLPRIQKQAVVKRGRLTAMLLRIAVAAAVITIVVLSAKIWLPQPHAEQAETPVKKTGQVAVIILQDTVEQVAPVAHQPVMIPQPATGKLQQQPAPYLLLNSFEQNYNKLVRLQLKSIRSTPVYGETSDYFNSFKQRMQQIELDEAALKSNIKTNGLNDKLLEQLINVFQEKINLLKSLQQEIANMNNKIKENRQPADSTRIFYINI